MAVGRETVAGEVDVVADALRAIAVVAHAIEAAGRVASQTGRVDGGSDVAGTGKGSLDRGGDLVHPDDVNNIVRAPSDGGNAVATSVNIDDHTILGNGVGAGKEVVHVHRIKIALAFLFGRFGFVSVNDFILAAIDEFTRQSHLTDGLRTTPCDAAALGHERLDKCDGFSGGGAIVRLEVAAFQMLDDAAAQQFVMDFNRCHF